ncbi:leukocyte elastase inhibitor-like [Mya arenaria]|uniref:leukocyte elastase inhibitor-like n=1 Tax=Mya arenaria TaxID=6604 RepID=UPI0022E3499F|nr:leukocyte elastase inhibitor-like [Mya arenaria]
MASENPKVSASANEFTLDIYKAVTESSKNDNLFIAPTSILVVMAMVQVGARNVTKDQMVAALKLKFRNEKELLEEFELFSKALNQGSRDVTLQSANKLYPDKGKDILQEYISVVSKHFGTEIEALEFSTSPEPSRMSINKWVEEFTNHKIKDLLPNGSINALTRLVIVNAIYFKGNWATQFKPENTKKDNFHLIGGKTATIDMMNAEMENVRYGESSEHACKVLHLPYIGEELAMIVVLPKDTDGLLKLEQSLDSPTLNKIINDVITPTVVVSLPKFKLESSFALSNTLSALGMVDVFSEAKADLSGMGKKLYVSQVFHKAFVDVNEEGTEAAAATAAVMMTFSLPPPPSEFKADHPFLFLIWNYKLNAPLFIGRYMHPPSAPIQTHEEL